MSIRIAIDATSCAYAPMSGTGVYVRNLVTELLRLGRDVEYHLISSKPCDLDWANGAVKWFGEGELAKHNIIWWAIKGNRLLSRIKADVFWSPFQFFPVGMSKRRRAILTILDLVWYHMPHVMDRRNYLMNKSMMRRSIKKASSIIAISQSTRDDLLDNFEVKGKEIYPIHLSASADFSLASKTELEETVRKYPMCSTPYILAVGALEPRKNHLRIVKAIEKLRVSGYKHHNLIIVGSSGWRNGEFFDYLSNSNANSWVHILNDVEKCDLRGMYNMAELLVFPSLMEGFGIPILEAMACGCPVVTSNVSSMPEIAGDAAMLVDPCNVEDISDGILRTLENRDKYRTLGLERAKRFSWRKSAEKHLQVFLG